jgi:hypothetical protein
VDIINLFNINVSLFFSAGFTPTLPDLDTNGGWWVVQIHLLAEVGNGHVKKYNHSLEQCPS